MSTKEKVEAMKDVEERIKIHNIMKDLAIKNAEESMDCAINTLVSAVEEIKIFKKRMMGSLTFEGKADTIEWAINHITSNILPNVRIDLMVKAHSRLLSFSEKEG